MARPPRVAVVVPVHNHAARTLRFLDSFRRVRYPAHTLVVVDDGSTDGTADLVRRHTPAAVVLAGGGDLWWAGATNLGVRHALAGGADYVLTINNDAVVHEDFLAALVETAEAHPRALVGAQINFLDRPQTVWALGGAMRWARGEVLHLLHQGAHTADPRLGPAAVRRVDALTGCGTLVPAACYRAVGLYDAAHCPQYHADAEFVLRARRHGYAALVDRRAVVWNEAGHTAADSVATYRDWLFSRRSAVYWPAVWEIHKQHCPGHYRIPSLARYYANYFWYHDPRLRRLARLMKPWLRRLGSWGPTRRSA